MRSFFFFPPLPKVSGGMAVIARMAAILHKAGFEVALVVREPNVALVQLAPEVPVLPWNQLALEPSDVWMVPEGWPNALAPGLQAGARCLVYVQNWAFLLGTLPPHLNWNQLPVFFMAVSHPVAWFVRETVGVMPEILHPGIDLTCFHPAEALLPHAESATEVSACHVPQGTLKIAPQGTLEIVPQGTLKIAPQGTLKIAWMPRKNKALAHQIRHAFEARQHRHPCKVAVEWVEIHGRTLDEVASLLRSSQVFLATGFPEGCPLPPLEAMASGCVVVGFSGFGGWDYMRQALPVDVPGRFLPWWPCEIGEMHAVEREKGLPIFPQSGNGMYVADADIMGAVLALEHAINVWCLGGEPLQQVREAALLTAQRYSVEVQQSRVLNLWKRASNNELWYAEHKELS